MQWLIKFDHSVVKSTYLTHRTGRAAARRGLRGGRGFRGFTLIELLVVLAIIGLLVAILMPSLARSRALARRAVCSANLHNVGIAMIAYAVDHDDKFPDRRTLTDVQPGEPYSVTLYRRAWRAVDPDNPAAGAESLGLPALLGQRSYILDQQVWLCPAQSDLIRSFDNTYNWSMDVSHETRRWYEYTSAQYAPKELVWDNTKYRPSVPNNRNSSVLLLPPPDRFIPHSDAGGFFDGADVDAVNALMTDGRVTIRQHK